MNGTDWIDQPYIQPIVFQWQQPYIGDPLPYTQPTAPYINPCWWPYYSAPVQEKSIKKLLEEILEELKNISKKVSI